MWKLRFLSSRDLDVQEPPRLAAVRDCQLACLSRGERTPPRVAVVFFCRVSSGWPSRCGSLATTLNMAAAIAAPTSTGQAIVARCLGFCCGLLVADRAFLMLALAVENVVKQGREPCFTINSVRTPLAGRNPRRLARRQNGVSNLPVPRRESGRSPSPRIGRLTNRRSVSPLSSYDTLNGLFP